MENSILQKLASSLNGNMGNRITEELANGIMWALSNHIKSIEQASKQMPEVVPTSKE